MKKLKCNTRDFSPDMLPTNRKAQFKDILKLEWRTLFYIGIILFLFFVPEAILQVFKNLYMVANPSMTEVDILGLSLLVNVIQIFTFALFGVGIAGVFRIYRLLAWGEPVYFWSDFFKGIKTNYKMVFLVLILGLLGITLNQIICYLVNSFLGSSLNTLLIVLIDFVQIFFLIPVGLYSISYSNIYTDKPTKIIINSAILVIKSYIKIIPFALIPVGIFYIFVINNVLVTLIVLIIVFIVIIPLCLLAEYLVCLHNFDLMINSSYPEILNKGLSSYKEN